MKKNILIFLFLYASVAYSNDLHDQNEEKIKELDEKINRDTHDIVIDVAACTVTVGGAIAGSTTGVGILSAIGAGAAIAQLCKDSAELGKDMSKRNQINRRK